MSHYSGESMDLIALANDHGGEIRFRGRIFSECSYYDEETASITRQRLYVTDKGEQVYYIVSGSGQEKDRRAYLLRIDGENCIINNGLLEVTLRTDLLLASMRTLCGFNEGCSADLLKSLEDTLKAANV